MPVKIVWCSNNVFIRFDENKRDTDDTGERRLDIGERQTIQRDKEKNKRDKKPIEEIYSWLNYSRNTK